MFIWASAAFAHGARRAAATSAARKHRLAYSSNAMAGRKVHAFDQPIMLNRLSLQWTVNTHVQRRLLHSYTTASQR